MRNALLITYYFPPQIASAVFRAYSFFKYLPLYGWNLFILTVLENKINDFQKKTDNSKIFRSFHFDTKKHFSVLGRFPLFLAIPDNHIGWVPFAFLKSIHIIKSKKIELVLTSSYPWSASLIGLLIKKVLKLPWIIEFRDPWINIIMGHRKNKFIDYINSKLERKVLDNSDNIVVTTEQTKDYYLKKYPHLDNNKFSVIYNGFDEDQLRSLSTVKNDTGKFTIVYGGVIQENLYRNPKFFLQALSELVKEKKMPRDKLSLIFIGCGSYVKKAEFQSFMENTGIKENFKIIESVEQPIALEYFSKADILLLLQQDSFYNMCVPTKTFEYLALGKTIFCLTPQESETASLVKKYNPYSIVVDFSDRAEIKNRLLELYNKWQDNKIKPYIDQEFIALFNRKHQAEQLAAVFNFSFSVQAT